MKLQNIEYLIDGNGDITIGRLAPIRCAATAADGHELLAALVRRPNESITQLLERLDAAIGKALEDGQYIDEINPPAQTESRKRSRR